MSLAQPMPQTGTHVLYGSSMDTSEQKINPQHNGVETHTQSEKVDKYFTDSIAAALRKN